MKIYPDFLVLISANAEWQVIRRYFPDCKIQSYRLGEWFAITLKNFHKLRKPIIFIQGGWGKVSAAASTQFAISRWHPKMIINLGTCGGIKGEVSIGEIILVEKTLIYDIFEQMGDPEEHIKHYVSEIDNSWLLEPLPLKVRRTLLISGDRDLFSEDINSLKFKYGAIAGDWESGAIAWVAAKNLTQCLILRGVTDLVSEYGGDAYGNPDYYYKNTDLIMNRLIESLPYWLVKYVDHYSIEY